MKSIKVDQDLLLEGITIINSDFKILYVNETSERQFGKKSEELTGKGLNEIFPEKSLIDLLLYLEQTLKHKVTEISNHIHIVHESTNIWYKLKILPVPEGALILSMDISQYKAAELTHQEEIHDLEKIINITSQKLKDPILNMINITRILNRQVFTEEELTRLTGYLHESVINLNETNRDLNRVIEKLHKNHK